jgi:hypothetical protein
MNLVLKTVAAGVLTAGKLGAFNLTDQGTFYYPAKAYNTDVLGDYVIFRTGKTDTRYMDTLYAGSFTSNGTLGIGAALIPDTTSVTVTTTTVFNG